MNALQHGLRWLSIYGDPEHGSRRKERFGRSKAKRRALLREAAQHGLQRAGEEDAEPLARDYRGPGYVMVGGRQTVLPWQRWRAGMPLNIGSGRKADWCHISFLRYACFARTIHRELGWSGQDVRDAAQAMNGAANTGLDARKVRGLPDSAMGGIAGRIRTEGRWVEREGVEWSWEWAAGPWDHHPRLSREEAVEKLCWMAFLRLVLQPAWGWENLDRQLAELRANPARNASSMLVGEVRRLRGASVTDYRGCSGCEDLAVLHERPDVHDLILSRASAPRRIVLKDGREAYEVPFGLEKPAGFTACVVLGMSSEIVCRPEDETAVTRAALGMSSLPE